MRRKEIKRKMFVTHQRKERKMNYRHGDLALVEISELPKGLSETKTKIIMTGSNNNPHSFDTGKLYLKRINSFVFGYFVAKNTTLFHKEHGIGNKIGFKKAKIQDGIYELRQQNEDTHQGMRQVVD